MRGRREVVTGIVWQGDLHTVYLDPVVGPRDILAYVPEQHASSSCHRALPGGGHAPAHRKGPWCDVCTSPDRQKATIRRARTGRWKAA